MLRSIPVVIAILAGFPLSTWAQNPPGKQATDVLQQLKQDYAKKQQEYTAAMRSAKTPEERQQVMRMRVDPQPYAQKALAIAESNNQKLAPEAAQWVIQITPRSAGAEKAKLILLEKYPNNDATAAAAAAMSRDEKAVPILRNLISKSTSSKVQSAARYALGTLLRNDSVSTQKEAESLLISITEKYPNSTEATRAAADLKDMAIYGLGKKAPEVKGVDLQGRTFSLADYKGKAVLLDFWGFW